MFRTDKVAQIHQNAFSRAPVVLFVDAEESLGDGWLTIFQTDSLVGT
jgi:hypothetical protein